jgi:hypothetical protein
VEVEHLQADLAQLVAPLVHGVNFIELDALAAVLAADGLLHGAGALVRSGLLGLAAPLPLVPPLPTGGPIPLGEGGVHG